MTFFQVFCATFLSVVTAIIGLALTSLWVIGKIGAPPKTYDPAAPEHRPYFKTSLKGFPAGSDE